MNTPSSRTALVTGGAKRLGRLLSLALAEDGWDIALHCNRSRAEAETVCGEICNLGQRCTIHTADLRDDDDFVDLVPEVAEEHPKLALLVNNASTYAPGTITETDLELFQSQFDVNFKAPFFLSRDFRNHVPQGHIINLLDTRITSHRKHQYAAYTLAKKALAALTTMAAVEFAPEIRVNGIALGPVIAPPDEADAYLEHAAQRTPLLRPGSPEPVIDTLRFLLSNDHLTGQIIFCDGGENLLG